jgi:membrane peptidoglycan carboxypeptidase
VTSGPFPPGPPAERRRRAGLRHGNGNGVPPPAPGAFGPPVQAPGTGNGRGNGNGVPPPALRRRRASAYRHGRKPPRRQVLRVFLITLAVLSGAGTAAIGVVYAGYNAYKGSLPDPTTVADMEPPQDSYVYDNAGNLIHVFDADSRDGERHVHVALANVSRWVKLATVDVEDRHFYTEGSWDIPRLIAAGINDVTHKGNTQGASTITQQLAKTALEGSNLLGPTSPRSIDYKIKQIVLGNELAANFSKDQILEMYLNRISYGNHALGIETAAELYFLKPARDLDLAESALLSGLPQSPSLYDPTSNCPTTPCLVTGKLSKARQKVVLQAMVSNGDISQNQANTAYAEPLTVHRWTESEPNVAPAFVGYVEQWLQHRFGSSYSHPGGWRIYTTIDVNKQNLAQKIVHDNVAQNRASENMRDGSMVSLDPKTGEILTMVGSWDYSDPQIGQVNMTVSPNQVDPGSTIKLFTYSAAIASGKFTMTTPILDAPFTFRSPYGQTYSPQDYDGRWHGVCPLKECLGNSFNMPAVKVEVATGIPYINSLEIAAGVSAIAQPGNTPPPDRYAATLGDGITKGISLLDLADGAATIADLGIHHDPAPVTKITLAATGQALYTYDPVAAGRRILPDNVAFIMTEITSNDKNRVREFGANGPLTLPDRRVSAKTGTAAFFKDNLTVGWTPDLLTAVWVGSPYPSCLKSSDRTAMQRFINRGRIPDGGLENSINDPFTPQELRQLGLQPRPDIDQSCGHLNGVVSGVSGAAPIWNGFMKAALKGTAKNWYAIPPDVVQTGTGDDQDFFLPSTRGGAGGGTCYYWGPQPQPGNPCQYTGTGPPPFLSEKPTPPANAYPSPNPTGLPTRRPIPTPPFVPRLR